MTETKPTPGPRRPRTAKKGSLSHIDAEGRVHIVDVRDKTATVSPSCVVIRGCGDADGDGDRYGPYSGRGDGAWGRGTPEIG